MSDFGSELARLMTARGVGVRQLARVVYCNPGHISNLRNGKARPSPELAAELDRHLGAGGVLADAARQPVSGRQRGHARPRIRPSRAVEALQVTMSGVRSAPAAVQRRSQRARPRGDLSACFPCHGD